MEISWINLPESKVGPLGQNINAIVTTWRHYFLMPSIRCTGQNSSPLVSTEQFCNLAVQNSPKIKFYTRNKTP